MNILIRADSSSTIGLGHIMRDLVLAKSYPEDTVVFACQYLEGAITEQIPYPVYTLQSNAVNELIDLIQKLHIELLIIDHYAIGYNEEHAIKKAIPSLKLMALDDTYVAHECDILLNHNLCADASRYVDLVPAKCDVRCGSQYTLIRDEFYIEKKQQRSQCYDIVIAMGGSDATNLSIPILQSLDEDLHVSILTTTANQHLEQLQQYVNSRAHTILHVNTREVSKIMHQSRLGIITPSVIVHEALTLELPFIAIQTAPNQEEMFRYLQHHGYNVLHMFHPTTLQALMHQQRHDIKRINFTDLSLAYKEMILSWRNHPDISQWMYRESAITMKEHLSFIDTLHTRNDKQYYLISRGDKPVGVIDFTNITDDSCDIGLYANPALKAIGSLLMEQIIYMVFEVMRLQKIRAEAFSENIKALALYKKFGFKEITATIVNQRNVTVLELHS